MKDIGLDTEDGRVDPLAEVRLLNEPENLAIVRAAIHAAGLDSAITPSHLQSIILTLVQQKVQRTSDYERENVVAGFSGDDRRVAPGDIIKAIEKIRSGLQAVSEGFEVLGDARKLTTQNEEQRDQSLRTIQHAILKSVIHDVLCRIPNGCDLEEAAASKLPEYAPYMPDMWAGLFAGAEATASRALEVFQARDFRGPTNTQKQWLVAFIHSLAEIYEAAAGRTAAAPRPSGNVAADWRGPFSRLIAGLWPLTGETEPAPSSGVIKRALETYTSGLPTKPGP